MRRLSLAALSAIAIFLPGLAGAQPVNIPDPSLQAAIRTELGIPTGPIDESDMLTLTFLNACCSGVVNLTGLEFATNLNTLYLDNNQIVDVSPLAGLTNLTTLDLYNNQIVDISPLAGLTSLATLYLDSNQIVDVSPFATATLPNLRNLDLRDNQIVDISPFVGLTSLAILYLDSNQIVDVGPLAGLTNLNWLFLDNNQIVDILGLVSNTGLGTNDYASLSSNPLSCTAIDVDIPILQGRGVWVDHAVPACRDCRDNDTDGLTDLADPDCTDATDPFESPDANSYGAILEEMAGGLRLRDPAECGGAPFLAFETAASGDFHLVPGLAGGGEPGTVSFALGLDSLTATEVRGNGVRGGDPLTGRPTDRGAPPGASCTTGSEPDCWRSGEHPAINSNAFDAICDLTKGFTPLDPYACGQTLFNSQARTGSSAIAPLVMIALTNIASGQPNPATGGPAVLEAFGVFNGNTLAALNAMAARPDTAILRFHSAAFGADTPTPLAPLSADSHDGPQLFPPDLSPPLMIPAIAFWTFTGVDRYLTDEQEALLGCGPFYGTRCDREGMSLMRSELSALLQSFPRPEGACGSGGWDTTDPTLPQPGTMDFAGEPICTRDVGDELHILPGCRGPGDPGYDPEVDGTLTGPDSTTTLYPEQRRHPFTNQIWGSEMAVLSWNHLEALVVLSFALDPTDIQTDEFDPDDPFRLDGCSFANPLSCINVASTLSITTLAPEEDSGPPPLRHWIWEAGGEYLVTEATGDLAGFQGWRLFAFGPEQSRVSGADVGVLFFLAPPNPEVAIPDSPMIVRHAGLDGDIGTADDNFAGIAYGIVETDCADGVDSDGDGIADHCECGDISGDGYVNTIDARLIQRCAVGEDLPGICENSLCDTTGEGNCNTIDARLIQRLAVGELTKQDLHCAARP